MGTRPSPASSESQRAREAGELTEREAALGVVLDRPLELGPMGRGERHTEYSSNMAPIGFKLWEMAFQTICNFRFADAGK